MSTGIGFIDSDGYFTTIDSPLLADEDRSCTPSPELSLPSSQRPSGFLVATLRLVWNTARNSWNRIFNN